MNITLNIDEEIVKKVRKIAIDKDTTLTDTGGGQLHIEEEVAHLKHQCLGNTQARTSLYHHLESCPGVGSSAQQSVDRVASMYSGSLLATVSAACGQRLNNDFYSGRGDGGCGWPARIPGLRAGYRY